MAGSIRFRLVTKIQASRMEIKIPVVRAALREALQEIADGMYDSITAGELGALWDRNGVDFRAIATIRGDNAYATIATSDDLYNWLNYGTDTRWAVMNNPFSPATQAGSLSATRGTRTYNSRGEYTRIRGRSAMQQANMPPRPGIQARRFDEAVIKEWEDKAADLLQEALNRGLRSL